MRPPAAQRRRALRRLSPLVPRRAARPRGHRRHRLRAPHAGGRTLEVRPGDRQWFKILARSEHTAIQAFRAGPWLQGVQLHPEIAAPVLAAYVRATAVPGPAPVRASSHGPAILQNFIDDPTGTLLQRAPAS